MHQIKEVPLRASFTLRTSVITHGSKGELALRGTFFIWCTRALEDVPTCHKQLIEELTSVDLFSDVQRRSPETGQVPQQTVLEMINTMLLFMRATRQHF